MHHAWGADLFGTDLSAALDSRLFRIVTRTGFYEDEPHNAFSGFQCSWEEMQQKKSGITAWWPGYADQGECNDLTQVGRGCWHRARMAKSTPLCSEGRRCLKLRWDPPGKRKGQFDNYYTFTCPTWVKDENGVKCPLPPKWQACPEHFHLQREKPSSMNPPVAFRRALARRCPPRPTKHQFQKVLERATLKLAAKRLDRGKMTDDPAIAMSYESGKMQEVADREALEQMDKEISQAPEQRLTATQQEIRAFATKHDQRQADHDNCVGMAGITNGTAQDNVLMIFDVTRNSWYRCNQRMRCEPFWVSKIRDAHDAPCGDDKQTRAYCSPGAFCFERPAEFSPTYKRHEECVEGSNVWVVEDGDGDQSAAAMEERQKSFEHAKDLDDLAQVEEAQATAGKAPAELQGALSQATGESVVEQTLLSSTGPAEAAVFEHIVAFSAVAINLDKTFRGAQTSRLELFGKGQSAPRKFQHEFL